MYVVGHVVGRRLRPPKTKGGKSHEGKPPLSLTLAPPPRAAPPPPPSPSYHIAAAGCATTRAASRMVLAGIFAAGAGAIVRDGTDASPLLGRLLGELNDLFAAEVLSLLNPTDLALLARACWKCGEAVVPSGFEIAGESAEEPLRLTDFVRSVEVLAWGKDNGCPWNERTCAPPLREGTWRRCGGRGSTIAGGTQGRVCPLLGAATWRCWCGRGSTTARGAL